MNINPSQFAFYLKSSSLSSAEQRAVLKRLPAMSEADVKTLFERLKKDHELMSAVLQQAHAKRDHLHTHFADDITSQTVEGLKTDN